MILRYIFRTPPESPGRTMEQMQSTLAYNVARNMNIMLINAGGVLEVGEDNETRIVAEFPDEVTEQWVKTLGDAFRQINGVFDLRKKKPTNGDIEKTSMFMQVDRSKPGEITCTVDPFGPSLTVVR